jgi:hypothetical protein
MFVRINTKKTWYVSVMHEAGTMLYMLSPGREELI